MAEYVHSEAYYINNADFYQAMVERKKEVTDAVSAGHPKPPVSPFIAKCIMDIANHLSYKSNFARYTFRDEFVLDAIENCLVNLDKFSPDISNNPFWYFTRICYRTFIKKILEERKQTFIKGKIVSQLPFDVFSLADQDSDGLYTTEFLDIMQQFGAFNDVVAKEEERMAKKKSKKAAVKSDKATLDDLFEDTV